MRGDRPAVPDSRIVDVEPHPALPGGFPPYGEAVFLDPGRRPADLRRIPRPAGVAFTVVLDVVGPDAVQQAADHLLGDVGPQRGVGLVGMEVEVEAEEGVPAGGGGCGGIDWQGPWRRGRKRRWRQGRAERTNPAAFYRRES